MDLFSSTLKKARVGQKLRQGELCERVNEFLSRSAYKGLALKQPLYSAWETGSQTPSGKQEAVVEAVAQVLGLPAHDLFGAWRASGLKPRGVGLTEQQYLQQVRLLIGERDQHGNHLYDLWILLPNPLAVAHSVELRNLWLEQIEAGMRCHIVWDFSALTLAQKDNAREAADLFCQMEEELQARNPAGNINQGHILNYAIECSDGADLFLNGLVLDAKEAGETFYKGWRQADLFGVEEAGELRSQALEGSTVAYVPRNGTDRNCRAGMVLDNVCFSTEEKAIEGPLYLWFGRARRARLCELARTIQQAPEPSRLGSVEE